MPKATPVPCVGSLGSQSGAAVVMMMPMGSDDEGGPEDNNIKQTAVCVPTPHLPSLEMSLFGHKDNQRRSAGKAVV